VLILQAADYFNVGNGKTCLFQRTVKDNSADSGAFNPNTIEQTASRTRRYPGA